ncbi:2-polyprenyl-3-methyl-5-hydroxy-6-metoxy-1,4-benzoquinol methylase [Sphingobium xanthum]|jgi:2-polyprenyl-3-methyl-5-hydroxy-6-metoxy-1,4-benzoquinol methylase|uniref:class I SAM-dependent methyltransferase n=1 Tax=Sphingobium xanthum TaxID=1387165 RepID=UPI001C8B7B92|nr:class I SAM-dependent methyltransferase [Sphingobium xanthum]
MTTGDDLAALRTQLARWPNLLALSEVVVETWPEHAGYLSKSFDVRSEGMMATSDHVARAMLLLAGDRKAQVAADYRWLCDRIREEELEFARSGHYRYSSFEQTNAHVYSNDDFMERYMHGLLYSHVLWYMHASSLHFFRQRLEARVPRGGRVLEVGSGHGLLLYLALTDFGLSEAHGWDLSEVSLAQTRHALKTLGAEGDNLHFRIQDMHQVQPDGETYDLVILSHILEHLDDPVEALQKMRGAVSKKGVLFVNVPLNAPMPDHVILLENPDMAADLLVKGGFRIVEMATHTTQAKRISQALRQKIAVTCSIIAEPA